MYATSGQRTHTIYEVLERTLLRYRSPIEQDPWFMAPLDFPSATFQPPPTST